MEFFTALLESLFSWLWDGRFEMGSLTPLQFALLLGYIYLAFRFLSHIFGTAKKGVVVTGKALGRLLTANKRKMAETVCPHCGRTLDKCVCPSNKGLSLRTRYKKYKLELKARKRALRASKRG
jgi:rRNA maturation protein Nop10